MYAVCTAIADYALGYGMCRYLFTAAAEVQELLVAEAACARDARNSEAAVRERPRLVKGYCLDLAERLYGITALEEDAKLRRRADTREIRQRYTQHKGARAAYYKEGQRRIDPFLPVACDERAEQRCRCRYPYHYRCVHLGKASDETVKLRLRGGSVLDGVRYLCYHGIVRGGCRAEGEGL